MSYFSEFTDLVDLAQPRLGGAVVYANDDFFASKDNLLKPDNPIFLEGEYTDRGKWMDGWESRRRRTPGHDFCIVRLGLPGLVRGVIVDTAFFKGNYPEACSIDACAVPGQPDPEVLLSDATHWFEILPKHVLRGDTTNPFGIDRPQRVTHLRLNIYPDGGVARLRVHGDVLTDPRWMGRPGAPNEVDLAAVEHGGVVVACNDMFFGSRHNLIAPGRSVNMGDGWETKRSRREGPDWVIVKLAAQGEIHRVEIDTNHFKGNYPESAALFVCHAPGAHSDEVVSPSVVWKELLPRTKLQPHMRHFYESELRMLGDATHVKMCIWPDGGVSRLRLWGVVGGAGRSEVALRHLNALPDADAERALRACCGSSRWVKRVASGRPFLNLAALLASADAAWAESRPEDIREAFDAHPRIGEGQAKAAQDETARAWSEGEQASMRAVTDATRETLVRLNRDYEERFGHIFIVCATGKTPAEMLALLEARMNNDPATELRIAAAEQHKITRLRLEKLVSR